MDHTVAQYFRNRHQATTPSMEHMVTTSVSTARPAEIGAVEVTEPSCLLLSSDGVHKILPQDRIREILRQPTYAANALVEIAIAAGGTDNATAMVVMNRLSQQSTATNTDTERFTMHAA
jgi:protein phosphatase